LLVAALIVGQPDRDAKEPAYQVIEVRKPVDSVVAQKEKDRTVFVVTSESGIGDATIVLTSGQWPENFTLRFVSSKGQGVPHDGGHPVVHRPRRRAGDAEVVREDALLLRGA
jgi:hypothetical protein